MPRALALLALVVAVTARASERRCTATAGPTWRELRTDHFVLSTNLPEDEADDLAEQREEFPEWDPASAASTARLDRALLRYADGGRYVETRFKARGEGASRLALMGPAEVHALRSAETRWEET